MFRCGSDALEMSGARGRERTARPVCWGFSSTGAWRPVVESLFHGLKGKNIVYLT